MRNAFYNSGTTMALGSNIKNFTLELFNGNDVDREPEYSCQGVGLEWLNYQQIKLPGFDAMVSVSLESVWQEAIQQQKSSATVLVTGYETIVKFSNTMQLKTPFTAKLSINYV